MKMGKTTVLQFESVVYRSSVEAYASFGGASFTLPSGGLVGVHIDHDSEHVPIADLATGLLPPTSGRICFGGKDWQRLNPFAQAAARGGIGCVLEAKSWISSLTVKQNIMLRERHHTSRSDADIEREAQHLCKRAGLPGIPESRPDLVRPRELRILEWVRAVLGTPALAVLVFPERDAFSGASAVCMDLVDQARAEGTAVIWISDRNEVWQDPHMADAEHYEIKDGQWMPYRRTTG